MRQQSIYLIGFESKSTLVCDRPLNLCSLSHFLPSSMCQVFLWFFLFILLHFLTNFPPPPLPPLHLSVHRGVKRMFYKVRNNTFPSTSILLNSTNWTTFTFNPHFVDDDDGSQLARVYSECVCICISLFIAINCK